MSHLGAGFANSHSAVVDKHISPECSRPTQPPQPHNQNTTNTHTANTHTTNTHSANTHSANSHTEPAHTEPAHTQSQHTYTQPAHTLTTGTHSHSQPAHTQRQHTQCQLTYRASTHTEPAHTQSQHTHRASTNSHNRHKQTTGTHTHNRHTHTHSQPAHTHTTGTHPAHNRHTFSHTQHTTNTKETRNQLTTNTHPTHNQHTPSTHTPSTHTHSTHLAHTTSTHAQPAHTTKHTTSAELAHNWRTTSTQPAHNQRTTSAQPAHKQHTTATNNCNNRNNRNHNHHTTTTTPQPQPHQPHQPWLRHDVVEVVPLCHDVAASACSVGLVLAQTKELDSHIQGLLDQIFDDPVPKVGKCKSLDESWTADMTVPPLSERVVEQVPDVTVPFGDGVQPVPSKRTQGRDESCNIKDLEKYNMPRVGVVSNKINSGTSTCWSSGGVLRKTTRESDAPEARLHELRNRTLGKSSMKTPSPQLDQARRGGLVGFNIKGLNKCSSQSLEACRAIPTCGTGCTSGTGRRPGQVWAPQPAPNDESADGSQFVRWCAPVLKNQLSFRHFLGDHLPSLQWSLSSWVSCNLNFRCFLDGRLLHHPVRHHQEVQRHLDHLPLQLEHCGIECELKAAATAPLVLPPAATPPTAVWAARRLALPRRQP